MAMMPILSHVDLRVRDRKRAEAFYEQLFTVLGGEKSAGKNWTTFGKVVDRGLTSGQDSHNWLGFTEDKNMTAGSARVALYAPDRDTVNRVAELLPAIGAKEIEWDEGEYGEDYYAIFFLDLDGNALEVCCYESKE